MKPSELFYSRPAQCFEEALPIGNGLMGAMVYGGIYEDKISLNHCHLWSGEPHHHSNPKAKKALEKARVLAEQDRLADAQRVLETDFTSQWSESFLALGELRIQMPVTNHARYRRTLCLDDATVRITQGKPEDGLRRQYFASHPAKVIAVSYTLTKRGDFEIALVPKIRSEVTAEEGMLIARGRCPYLQRPHYYVKHGDKNAHYAPDRGIPFTAAVKPVTDGTLTMHNGWLLVEDATYLRLYLSCFTGFVSFDAPPSAEHERPCLEAVKAAAGQGIDALFEEHVKDFSSLYSRVELELDTREEPLATDKLLRDPHYPTLTKLLFDYGRYLLISSSRKESAAANLQGIWNEQPFAPWCANYTVNINTQMNYWPAGVCNLSECAEPLTKLVEALRSHGSVTAREFYGAPGFVCHHNSDLWAHTEPVGAGEAGSAVFAFWPMASGWFACQLYDLYRYSPDETELKDRIYPILRDAALFYLHLLTEDEEGKSVLSPSTSPENAFLLSDGTPCAVAKWSAMSQQILEKLLSDCLECQSVLKNDPETEERIRAVLPRLRKTLLAPDGTVCEWNGDYHQREPQHRHVSHLWALFPGGLYSAEEAPAFAEACRKTLAVRGDGGTGWSLGWKINLFAYLKDGDHAFELLKNQLRPCLSTGIEMTAGGSYPNLLDAHPPFQIDGNFGAVSGIASLLMQSTADRVEILPALPKKLANGRVKGLRAKNGILCSFSWKKGGLTSLSLSCEHPVSITLVTPAFSQRLTLTPDTPYSYEKED